MTKQIRKSLAIVGCSMGFIIGAVLSPASYGHCGNTVSDVADQKSVIDEQKQPIEIGYAETPTVSAITIEVETKEVTSGSALEKETVEKETKTKTKKKVKKYHNRFTKIIDKMSDYDKYLLYQITFAEAGNQPIEGQRAVMEVIFNRVLSDEWPDSVVDVLGQPGQFSTWYLRDSVSHNKDQEKALKLVASKEPILNSSYVYFSTTQQSYGANYIAIKDHWFGTSR